MVVINQLITRGPSRMSHARSGSQPTESGCALALCLNGVGFALGTLGFLLVPPNPPLAAPLDSLLSLQLYFFNRDGRSYFSLHSGVAKKGMCYGLKEHPDSLSLTSCHWI